MCSLSQRKDRFMVVRHGNSEGGAQREALGWGDKIKRRKHNPEGDSWEQHRKMGREAKIVITEAPEAARCSCEAGLDAGGLASVRELVV